MLLFTDKRCKSQRGDVKDIFKGTINLGISGQSLGAGCREHIPTPSPAVPPPDTPAPRGGPAWPNSADTELRLPDPEPSIPGTASSEPPLPS